MGSVQDAFPVRNHRLPAEQFQALCGGAGGPDVVRALLRSERSRRLLLVDQVFRTAAENPGLMGPLPPATAAWDVLAAAGDIDELILHPQVGSWAAFALRRHRGRVSSPAPEWVDFGVLHTIALIAAARAGLSWQTRLPARAGRVMLPTLGMADVGPAERWSAVAARCASGTIRLSGPGAGLVLPVTGSTADPRWLPSRRLASGVAPRLSIFLEDLDPYRDLAEPVEPERLDNADAARWQAMLDDAWSILCRHHRDTAEALATGVMSLVPLADNGGGTRSASSGEAFGGVLMSPPVDGTDLAVSLVHEFQHSKLGGLIHLGALTERDDGPLRYAPWRDDPRPLGGLLQGIYAFTGITDFWRAQRLVVAPDDRHSADFEYAYAREQVARALAEVDRHGGLTEWGRAVSGGLSARLRSWQSDVVAAGPAKAAALLAAIHRTGWRIRHLAPDPEQVRALADGWPRRSARGFGDYRPTVHPAPPERWSLGWQSLIRRQVAARTSLITPRLRAVGVSAADVALARGDTRTATVAYRARLASDPSAADAAWTGLAVGCQTTPAMRHRPELVRAVHDELVRRASPADPVEVARWLGTSGLRPVLPDDRLDASEAR